MKIVVLGQTGQVGRALLSHLQGLGEVVGLGRVELNLDQLSQLAPCLAAYAPDVIVNAVAYTAVDQAESEPLIARHINTHLVDELAQFAKQSGALLIHYSTDYVFDGEKMSPYLEADATNPLSIYGQTKRDGELALLTSGCRGVVLRTSWVYSRQGRNFINTILQLARTKTQLSVVADQWGAPTSAEWIAEMTAQVIQAYQREQLGNGIAHLTASGSTTWHALAQFVVEMAHGFGWPLSLHSEQIVPIATADYPLPARRPSNSRLDTQYLSRCLQQPFIRWQEPLEHLLSQYNTPKEAV